MAVVVLKIGRGVVAVRSRLRVVMRK